MASSVVGALQIAERASFDLVIFDVGSLDGTEIELMKTRHTKYGVRGIASTGCRMENDLRRTRQNRLRRATGTGECREKREPSHRSKVAIVRRIHAVYVADDIGIKKRSFDASIIPAKLPPHQRKFSEG